MRKQLLLIILTTAAFSAPGKDYQVQALEEAHAAFHSATNAAMYAAAAAQYESLIREEGIRNENLFYTTGNSWFMAGDLGRAILNYRRAGLYMPDDADLKYNLDSALERRADLIPAKEATGMTKTLLGWHLNTSTRFRWVCFAVIWIAFWAALFWMYRTTRKEVRVTAGTCGVISALLLISLISESVAKARARPGVITAKEVVARKGDGNMYAPAFLDPLHSGTEFQSLETRGNWQHIRLDDGQSCWIPSGAGETVSLR